VGERLRKAWFVGKGREQGRRIATDCRGEDASGTVGDGRSLAPASPRAVMIEHLSRGMTAALATGDVDAARVAHEAIGKLLGSAGTGGVDVGDLDGERRKHGG